MRNFNITGMSCAACSARVEKAVSKLEGVENCSVNLLTNSMSVEGSVTDAEIIDAVEKAGYGASLKGENSRKNAPATEINAENKETSVIIKRLITSAILLAALMYVAMGHTMFGLPLPSAIAEN